MVGSSNFLLINLYLYVVANENEIHSKMGTITVIQEQRKSVVDLRCHVVTYHTLLESVDVFVLTDPRASMWPCKLGRASLSKNK